MSGFEGRAALPEAELTMALDGGAVAAEAPAALFADEGGSAERLAGGAADLELPTSRE
jgi:hypothetical protein